MKRKIIVGVLFCFTVLPGVFAAIVDIKGRVLHAANRGAIEFANIVLQTPDSVFITGTVTDIAGAFAFDKVEAGDYRLVISSIGYKTQYIDLNGYTKNLQLNEILLEDESVNLEGVTVTASATTSRSDRKIIFPSENQVKASTNGINLLQQLMLPRVQVNPLLNEVKLPGGGEIQYRINGAKVEIQDITALQPASVIRIEFHDNPGLRYGNAEVVLDYIVHRPETGGNFSIDLSDAVVTEWGNNSVNGKVNHKKSEFSMYYGISHRNFYNMWRDNEEKFTFEDGSILQRQEIGEPGHGQMYWQNLNGTYSFQDDHKMFNAVFRYYTNNQPHWDYKGTLYNMANPADAVYMVDNSSFKTHRPALDLYYQHDLKNEQTLVFNAVGTYNYTENSRFYQESRDNMILTNVGNLVAGKKYSIIGEGIYEKKIGNNRISGGLKHTQSWSDNEYRNGHEYTTEMDQSETFLYAEFNGKVQKLDYTLGAGATRSSYGQEGDESYSYYTFNPRIVLHYALPGNSFVRLRGDINNSSPSLSNLSAVEQTIDSLQIQRGNPALKNYLRYRTELTYELQKGIFNGNLWGVYEYSPKAIMDEKYLENGKIVQTWNNQKNWQRAASRLTLRIGPVKNIATLSVTGGVNHYISNGNTYKHEYTNWFTNMQLNAMYKKFTAGFILETNWNWFYGETMSGGENIHLLMLGYRHKNLSLTAGMFNPFVDNYKQQTENWSEYASYKKSNYVKESSRTLIFQFVYNFSFGRTFKSGQKRLNNTDEDSGVMNSGK
ncbi:MAG: carboxypeptidase-like regulatory domain-containing protein [Tannerella sp.]|nr:carboxypeptidase-like regulatory domain-containing protein [Tannerella sp.]